jgi:hypothetical protein
MEASKMGTEATVQLAVPQLDDYQGGKETNVLVAALHLSTMLPHGWRAEVGPGSIVLSWHAG